MKETLSLEKLFETEKRKYETAIRNYGNEKIAAEKAAQKAKEELNDILKDLKEAKEALSSLKKTLDEKLDAFEDSKKPIIASLNSKEAELNSREIKAKQAEDAAEKKLKECKAAEQKVEGAKDNIIKILLDLKDVVSIGIDSRISLLK